MIILLNGFADTKDKKQREGYICQFKGSGPMKYNKAKRAGPYIIS
jgi:hypothetical protein